MAADAAGGEAEPQILVSKEDFFKKFKAEEESVRDVLSSLAGGDQVHEALDALLARHHVVEADFTRHAHLLPPYDVQKYRSSLKTLASDIAARREQLAPRKKFSFKRRAQPANNATEATGPVDGYKAAEIPAEVSSSSKTGAFNGELIEGLKGSCVKVGPGELQGRDVSLRDLEDCRVVLLDQVGALHVHRLQRCEIVIAAVSSSALMHHCHECIFTFAAKQLRLHDSDQVVLHLHTRSSPIIEHCKNIMFAPFDLVWPGLEELLQKASLGSLGEDGPWSDVQDFNWLKRQASPNWCLVPTELRRASRSFGAVADAMETLAASEKLPPSLPELDMYRDSRKSTEPVALAPTLNTASTQISQAETDPHADEF
eukprot:TRINITY_DN32266_c0_g1_i1.p1 TRINITY_DN32266_c0_g1~~TRINITY_DN32266_c0_g1_i1.p1  ORF type:complete len:371 (-),score=60.15 TRINITY_DN32266_c0_g1_i1:251-1363(-)